MNLAIPVGAFPKPITPHQIPDYAHTHVFLKISFFWFHKRFIQIQSRCRQGKVKLCDATREC